jgi:hypothetical protein
LIGSIEPPIADGAGTGTFADDPAARFAGNPPVIVVGTLVIPVPSSIPTLASIYEHNPNENSARIVSDPL